MQKATDKILLNQINAGINGRRKGHFYEEELSRRVNEMQMPYLRSEARGGVVHKGKPEIILIDKILDYLCWDKCDNVSAYATGKLATSEYGEKQIDIEGVSITSTKSDIILVMTNSNDKRIVGISVKQCNNKVSTNPQIFFTTATAFYNLLRDNGMALTDRALLAMRQFCGDLGFRPMDNYDCSDRESTPERYFWEEIDGPGRMEWEQVFKDRQDDVTRLLLCKGYNDDPCPPEIILHKTRYSDSFDRQEIVVFDIGQFLDLSKRYSSFACTLYRVNKGRYKESQAILHQAPRFGVIQMQRGGQKQHPTQLQFNLKSNYFKEFEVLLNL